MTKGVSTKELVMREVASGPKKVHELLRATGFPFGDGGISAMSRVLRTLEHNGKLVKHRGPYKLGTVIEAAS